MNTPSRVSVLDCGCPSAAFALGAKDFQSLRLYLRAGSSERKAPEGQAQSKTSRTFGRFTESLNVFLTRSGTMNTPWRASVLDCGCPSGILCLGRWRYRARTKCDHENSFPRLHCHSLQGISHCPARPAH